MITFVEGKSIAAGERCAVYFNLHKGGFSVKSMDKRNPHNGLVVAYADYVTISDASFHVMQSRLKNILAKRQKEIYAVVRGVLVDTEAMDDEGFRKGYVNPYTTGHFIDLETRAQLTEAQAVHFYDRHFSYQ